MEITRDVILDLLPLYLAGEVSDDSRALIKHYLESEPVLAKIADAVDRDHFDGRNSRSTYHGGSNGSV